MYYALVKDNQVERILFSEQDINIDGQYYSTAIFNTGNVDDLIAIGIYPYTDVTKDLRYYTHGEVEYTINAKDVVGVYPGVANSVDEMKKRLHNTLNNQVSQRQGAIDWYWSRASKGGKEVPTDIQTYADTLYTEQATKEVEINALTTLDAVIAYDNVSYTLVRNDNGENVSATTTMSTLDVWGANPKDTGFVSLTKA